MAGSCASCCGVRPISWASRAWIAGGIEAICRARSAGSSPSMPPGGPAAAPAAAPGAPPGAAAPAAGPASVRVLRPDRREHLLQGVRVGLYKLAELVELRMLAEARQPRRGPSCSSSGSVGRRGPGREGSALHRIGSGRGLGRDARGEELEGHVGVSPGGAKRSLDLRAVRGQAHLQEVVDVLLVHRRLRRRRGGGRGRLGRGGALGRTWGGGCRRRRRGSGGRRCRRRGGRRRRGRAGRVGALPGRLRRGADACASGCHGRRLPMAHEEVGFLQPDLRNGLLILEDLRLMNKLGFPRGEIAVGRLDLALDAPNVVVCRHFDAELLSADGLHGDLHL
eukprot:scaffold115_cov241-Pinguiococcus_pyrenoidosus.AAC.7